ncbi:type II secretion system F family protein [Streptomyces sp. NBC_01498]|uniref:type II secretion system F family protein n=1 Tax=Streptomyces sp. NBC_01498 TaxID=2975870 RepID=UPI002E7BBE8F|nr:type II secretion system F family protein [Streptomyces sp. NBC_01498]WTL24897.1 type II secretion system F family protein [Streptomyces sp. NBC_01498]
MDNLPLLTIGVTLLTCVLGVIGVHVYSSGKAQREALVDRMSQTGQITTSGRQRRFGAFDRRLRATGFGKRVERKITVTGLDLTPGEYLVYMAAGLLGLYFLIGAVFASFFGVLAALAGLWGGNAFLNWQRVKRTEAFINQLPELTRVLANATQAGLAMRTALVMASEELDNPAGEELRKVADQLAVGQSLDDALDELAQRLPSRELVVLVTTLVLSSRAGGQVVTSLRNLTETLEERKETRREVKTVLSQIQVTALAVPAIGLGFLLLINNMTPGALDKMTGATAGQVGTILAFALYAVGYIAIRRMSRIQV